MCHWSVIFSYVQNDWPVAANDVRCDCFFASHITSSIFISSRNNIDAKWMGILFFSFLFFLLFRKVFSNFCFYFTSAFFSCFSSPIGTCIGQSGDGTRGLSEQIWMAQTEEWLLVMGCFILTVWLWMFLGIGSTGSILLMENWKCTSFHLTQGEP